MKSNSGWVSIYARIPRRSNSFAKSPIRQVEYPR